jgi:hypothetical protein
MKHQKIYKNTGVLSMETKYPTNFKSENIVGQDPCDPDVAAERISDAIKKINYQISARFDNVKTTGVLTYYNKMFKNELGC